MHIRNESGDHKYFTMIPNFIYALGLSPYAVALYGRIKQVAGEEGECTQSTVTLAKGCQMSAGMVSAAKKELAEKELITIDERPAPHGGKPLHCITVRDVWERNTAAMKARSSCESSNSLYEIANSQGEMNKNPYNKNITPDSNESGAPPVPESSTIPPKAPKPNPHFKMMLAISDVSGVPLPAFIPGKKRSGNYGYLGKVASELALLTPEPSPDVVRQYYGPGSWWYREDWRGQKGERPSPDAICKTWGQWLIPKVMPVVKPTKKEILAEAFARWDEELQHGKCRDHPSSAENVLDGVSFTVT